MGTIRAFAVTAGIAVTIASTVFAQGDGIGVDSREVRRFSVGALLVPYHDVVLGPIGRVFADRAWPGGGDGETVRPFDDPDVQANRLLPGRSAKQGPCTSRSLRGLIAEMSGHDDWRAAGGVLDVRGPMLLAVNEPERLARLERSLAAIRGAAAPRVRLRAWIVPRTDGDVEGMLAPDALRRRLDTVTGASKTPFGVAEIRPGDRVSFHVHKDRSLVVDVDIEIAQKSTADDPVTSVVRLGRALVVTPVLDLDGGIALFGYYTERNAPRRSTRSIGVQSERLLELADVSMCARAFGVRVGDGGAHVVDLGDDRVALIAAERLDAPVAPAVGALLPIGLLVDPVFTGGDEGIASIRGRTAAASDVVELVDAICGGGGKADVASLEPGPTLRLADAAHVEAARRVLAFEGAAAHRRFVVSVSRERRKENRWVAAHPPIRVPVLGDRLGLLVDGTDRLMITNYDVEVAQEANATDPIVQACFDGIQAAFCVRPTSEVACELEIAIVDRRVATPLVRTGPVRGAGALDLVEVRRATLRRTLAFDVGQTRIIGRGADSRIAVTVTELK